MADLLSERVQVASGGIDLSSAPERVPNDRGLEVENLLVDRDGVLSMRGPIQEHSSSTIGSPHAITGIWTFNDSLLIGRTTPDATAFVDPWVAPYYKQVAAGLAEPDTTMKFVDSAGSVSNVASSQSNVISGRGARLGSYVYGLAYSNSTDVTENGGTYHRRQVLRWGGTAANTTAYANAPDGGQDVIAHLNRIWVLGGRDVPGGGTTIEMNSLYYSDYGGPTSDTTAMWQNDTSGLTNKIVVDSDDQNDFGVGLAQLGQDLVIFKRRSIHVLYGYSDNTFTLRPLTKNLGCIDRRSIVEAEEGIYFMSLNGYMLFDGSTVHPVDGPVTTELTAKALNACGDLGPGAANEDRQGRVTAVALPNSYILISTILRDASSGTVVSNSGSAFLFHRPTGKWSRFSSPVFNGTVPSELVRTQTHYYACDGIYLTKLDTVTMPDALSPYLQPCEDANYASYYAIDVNWWSRPLALGTPLYKAQLHRILVDYKLIGEFELDGANDDKIRLDIYDDTGTQLYGTTYLDPITSQSAGEIERARYVDDTFAEANAIQLRLSWGGYQNPSSAGIGVSELEFYDCYVEYSRARQRRTVTSG